MGSFADIMKNAGLITEEAAEEVRKKDLDRMRQVQRSYRREKGGDYGLAQLEVEDSVVQFREQSKQLLLRDPSLITDILRIAHQFGDEESRKNLVWRLYTLRDELKKLRSSEDKGGAVRKLLSRKARPPRVETRKKKKRR